jgi:hypothetical protein
MEYGVGDEVGLRSGRDGLGTRQGLHVEFCLTYDCLALGLDKYWTGTG